MAINKSMSRLPEDIFCNKQFKATFALLYIDLFISLFVEGEVKNIAVHVPTQSICQSFVPEINYSPLNYVKRNEN
jgi:hypothetical protein